MSAIKTIADYVRETPVQSIPVKQERQDRLTDIIFILLIFSISYWLKFLIIDFYVQIVQNQSAFHFRNNYEEFYWLTSLFGWEPGQQIQIEGYSDFSWYYLPYVDNFAEGWNPYDGGETATHFPERMDGYVYGPLYIIWISLGKIFFGLDAAQSILVSNVIFDSLTSVMVYILAKRVTGNGIALILGFIHTITPISLFYANIYGLNTPQMTFFAVLYIWFYLEHHDTLGFIVLTLGFLTKQFPLLFAMPALMLMVRRYGWLRGFAFLVEFIIWSLIFSMPFIVLNPLFYVVKLFLASRAPTSVPTKEFLEENGGIAPNLVSSAVANEDYGLANQLHLIVDSQLLFLVGLFFLSYTAFSAYRFLEEKPYLFFRFVALYYFYAHGSIARGIYKYYTPFLIPFLILALTPNRKDTFHIRLGKLLHDSWDKVFDPRFRLDSSSIRYWGVFGLNILVLLGLWIFIDWNVSLFSPPSNQIWFALPTYSFMIVSVFKPHPTPQKMEITNINDLNGEFTPFTKIREVLNFSTSQIRRISYVTSFMLTGLVFHYYFSLFFNDNLFLTLLYSPGIVIFLTGLYISVFKWKTELLPRFSEKNQRLFSKIEDTIGLVVTILVFLAFYFNSETFFSGNANLLSLNVIYSFIVSLLLGYTIGILLSYLILQSRIEKTNPPKLDLNLVHSSFLVFLGYFLITLVSPLYFGNNLQQEVLFIIISVIILVLLLVLTSLITETHDVSKYWNYNPIIWILDLFQLVLLIFVIFTLSMMIFTIPRLLNPALIFLTALALIPYMGEEFWMSLKDYNLNAAKFIAKLLSGKRY